MSPIRRSRRRRARIVAVAATVAFAAAALATTAAAAPASGDTAIRLADHDNGRTLSGQGVTVVAKGTGTESGRTLTLPITAAETGKPASATPAPSSWLRFERGGRGVALTDISLDLASGQLTGKLAGEQTAVFWLGATPTVDPAIGMLTLRAGELVLIRDAAKVLRQRLELERPLRGNGVGAIWLAAAIAPLPPAPAPPVPPAPDPEPETDAYPYEAQCPVPSVEGSGGFAEPPVEVGGIAPSPVFNAGTSQEVTGTTVNWGFKDSFREYIAFVPPAGSLQAVEGAGANPAGPNMGIPGSFFDFPVATGTYEAGSAPDHSADRLVADGSGAALLCKSGHGFNIVIKNPTVTLDGEDSRITVDTGANLNGTWYPFQRVDLAELDLSAVEAELSDSGNTIVWEDIPATLTADGAEALGVYGAGEALDPITVETTLERPLLAECAIESGTFAPEPVVDFTLAPLPTLDDPVTGTGGTINWGFRRALRSTVKSNGSFVLLGGTTESYPGNMGGADEPAPEGGQGKFFRFPVSSYEYDDGEAGGADDRLIASSEATLGFCNAKHGYAAVLSQPTLVIDGAESRFIANAYSLQKGKGWIGGRVDVVDLDSTGVDATSAGGTVSWGEILGNEEPLSSGIPATGGLLTGALKLAAMSEGGAEGTFDPLAAQIQLPLG